MNSERLDLEDFPALTAARDSWEAGAAATALELFDRATADRPKSIRGLCEAGRAFGLRSEIARAEALLQRAHELGGGDARVAVAVARAFAVIGRPARALAIFEELRTRVGLEPAALAELAELYELTNRIDQAHEAVRASAEGAPDRPEPRLILARILRRRKDDAAAERLLEDLIRRTDAAPTVHAHAWAEFCHLRDSQGDYDGAVAAIESAKVILRQMPEAQRLARQALLHNELFRRLYAAIDQRMIDAWRAENLPPDPRCGGFDHLIGFPRTGTTLLEQVLDAHSGLVAAPERTVFTQRIFPDMYKVRGDELLTADALRAIPRDHLHTQRRRYIDLMEGWAGAPIAGRVLLDKNPNHTSLLAGLIRLFPDARYLFALRDPRDVIISNYLRLFRLSEFSASFLTWDGTCALYACDLSIWLQVRPMIEGSWLEVRYEDTVADLAGQSRRALEFVGLTWDPSVLDYAVAAPHKVVNSPSHAAVRLPVYQTAVGRWKNYEKHLQPYLDRLETFIKAFGYQ